MPNEPKPPALETLLTSSTDEGPPPGAPTAPGNMNMHLEQQHLVMQSAFA
jgi:hypothetical protein